MASRSIKKRYSTKQKRGSTIFLAVLSIIAAVVAACAIGLWALCSSWLQDLPDPTEVNAYNQARTTTVLANDETTVLAEFQLENRDPVELSEVSQYVLLATVDTEDERFYEHRGVDLAGIARAIVVNITGGQEGASTITQQLVRQTVLSSEMNEISIKRKVREIYLALKVEETYSKEDILQMYLNTINYGSGAYGIQAAAERYFSKNASELTLVEAATLVGIPQSPTYNNPIDNPDNCLERRNLVLNRMLTNGDITQSEYDQAVAEPLELNTSDISTDGIYKYPYFTSYVRDTLLNDYAYTSDQLFQGGLTVVTTLDPKMQDAAEAAAAKKLESADPALTMGIVAIDPDNGYIKAMVGGKDWTNNKVNVATGSGGGGRPAGSTFKTYALVAAIEAGIDPQKTYVDCGTTAKLPGWEVHNIDYHDYGVRTIARAFAVSSNTGFARISMSLGPEKIAEVAHRMGIESDLVAEGGLALGADSSPVTPLEMADAYATIANGGTRYDSTPILRVTDSEGNVLIDNSNPEGERAISAETAHAATEVMKLVVNSSEGTGRRAVLSSGQPVAGKTGTQENSMDIWFCGITPQLSVACWIGDPHNQVAVGNVGADDVFHDFMEVALEGQPIEQFPEADDPDYKDYDDDKYEIHTGSAWATSTSSSSDSEDDDDDDKKASDNDEKDDADKPSQPSGGNTGSGGGTGGNTGNTGGNTGSGGGGGNTGGSGGNTGGGGGTGGNTGGGNTGGGTGGNTGSGTGSGSGSTGGSASAA